MWCYYWKFYIILRFDEFVIFLVGMEFKISTLVMKLSGQEFENGGELPLANAISVFGHYRHSQLSIQ